MMDGWIKISRTIVYHWLWADAERLKWWFDLLFMAAWEDKKVMHDSHLFTLQRGQIIASVSFLADRWGKSHPTVIRFLKMLEDEGMVYRQTLYRQTPIITICNYDRYQVKEEGQVDTQIDTIVDSQVDPIVYTIKEQKEINNINQSKIDMSDSASGTPTKQSSVQIDYEKLVNYFNAETNGVFGFVRLPLSEHRKTLIRARLREHGKHSFVEVIVKAMASDFLKGQNGAGWKMTFDWLIKPTNYEKVLTGNYDKHAEVSQQQGRDMIGTNFISD